MDADQMQALRNLIEYNRKDERAHYEESDKPAGHIYEDILLLETYLDGDQNEDLDETLPA